MKLLVIIPQLVLVVFVVVKVMEAIDKLTP